MIRILAYILLWGLLLGVAIFATQNTLTITLKFLIFESINLPLGLVLVFGAGLGAVVVTILQATAQTSSSRLLQDRTRNASPPSGAYRYTRPQPRSPVRDSNTTSDKTSDKTSNKNNDKSDDDDWDDW